MKYKIGKISIVISIIILFVGVSVTPVFGRTSDAEIGKEFTALNKNANISPLDELAWQWAVKGGGIYDEVFSRICVDSMGNTYIFGNFYDSIVFGSITLTSYGEWDVFVAKLSPEGVWQWAKSAGGPNWDKGYGISIDSDGNIYVTGGFVQLAFFGTITLTSVAIDVFVAKMNANGDWQWAVQSVAGQEIYSEARGNNICIDLVGNTYVTGIFHGNVSFGSTMLTCNYIDVFVAKLSNNGVWQWAKSAGGPYWDESFSICADSTGNTYVTGKFYGTALFGSTTLTSIGDYDVFIAKLSTGGVWQWAKSAGGPWPDSSSSICVDSNGNIDVTGNFVGEAIFGSTTLYALGSYDDVFVVKLSTGGVWQWAVKGGGYNNDLGLGICPDSNGNIYVTGNFTGPSIFGSIVLNGSGSVDVFVAKLDANGVWQWVIKGGGTNDDGGNGIGIDSKGDLYVTGCFRGTTVFGSTTLTSSGGSDVFVAKLGMEGGENQPPNPPIITGPTQGKIKDETNYNFTTTDPDNDHVYYFIDWGDNTNTNWIGDYTSGEIVTRSHTWTQKGTYIIKAKAKDVSGAESNWSTLQAIMPLSYEPPHFRFFAWLFECFPYAFQILRYLWRY